MGSAPSAFSCLAVSICRFRREKYGQAASEKRHPVPQDGADGLPDEGSAGTSFCSPAVRKAVDKAPHGDQIILVMLGIYPCALEIG